jgi:hypothetical protein
VSTPPAKAEPVLATSSPKKAAEQLIERVRQSTPAAPATPAKPVAAAPQHDDGDWETF